MLSLVPSHFLPTSGRLCRFALLFACLFTVGTSPLRGDDARNHIKLLPQDINALAIVRVEEIMKTPRAQQEDWARNADERFLSGAGGIPSWVRTLSVGFLLRPSTAKEIWAAGIASVPESVTLDTIALREQSTVEQLNDMPAVQSRRNSFVLGISPGVLGIWRPAVRQEAGRWVRSLQAKVTGPLSDYLNKASSQPGHLVLAIDLENALDPQNTRAHLAMIPELARSAELQRRMHSVLMSLQGVTLSITIEQTSTAHLQIDFQEEVGALAPQLQQFFLSSLHDLGAAIEDFDQATFTANGKSLVMTSSLSDESLRRLVSMVTTSPSSTPLEPEMATPPPADSSVRPQSEAAASINYFRQVDRYLQDLSRANRRANNYSRTALWHENFANKIDELSIVNVDPVLITYGNNVSSRLRALGRSLRGQQLDVKLQQGTLTYDYDFNPGWASINVWGGAGFGAPSYRVTSNLQQVRERQAAAISAGASQREEIWSTLNEERMRVLREMQQKYGPDFDRATSGRSGS